MVHHHSFDLGGQIAGAAVRGVVYEGEHHLFHGMSTPAAIAVGLGIIALVVLAKKLGWI
ncbi:hypothetical protein [Paraburkholderia fungorum]|uniref:hypothetical protein n=1 Tax=Paraburkholderia fungorum TaxID=134537 RepID=UPI000B0D86A4|nr:hypothetical protein [Paraburkholderia fungorum]